MSQFAGDGLSEEFTLLAKSNSEVDVNLAALLFLLRIVGSASVLSSEPVDDIVLILPLTGLMTLGTILIFLSSQLSSLENPDSTGRR
mmetsp:Transcript_18759/g.30640  ORF Transcript_18759/g.30640 Transcript_18759/m.30640 type:complete len:87 (-) Transcript_18759:117-377(-)